MKHLRLVLLTLGLAALAAVAAAQTSVYGDVNCDGRVDRADVDELIGILFGARTTCATADVNADGRFSAADISAVEQAFGPTLTPTVSPTPSVTPTITRTPTITQTPTKTGSPTRTPTATRTGTASLTPTITRTPTPTPSGTRTRSVGPTSTVTLTPTVTQTPTPTEPLPPGAFITFFGLANFANQVWTRDATDGQGNPVYIPRNGIGAGFFIVVEAKAGGSGSPPGTKSLLSDPNNPSVRPDLQIEADHDLGNGSAAICDAPGPNPTQTPGGVPKVDPPSFDPSSQHVADALNDLGCRFELHFSADPCTVNANDNPAFVALGTSVQFCAPVGNVLEFPAHTDTKVTVQWRDVAGNIGNTKRLVVRVP